MHRHLRNRAFATLLSASLVALLASGLLPVAADDDLWPALRRDVFGQREIQDGRKFLVLDTPQQVDDAAVVPITIRIPPEIKGPLKSLTLVIDKNPAPVAATFKFGPAFGDGGGERRISTRVRIDTFSDVRAIAEAADGTLYMVSRFVSAAGGCSAPAPKDEDGQSADLGKIIVKSFEPAFGATALREAQIMIRHPNNSGMQRDQLSGGYVPARFIKEMVVKRGGELVFQMQSGIAISTDPNLRFTHANGDDNMLDVTATDTDEAVFTARSSPKGS